MLYSGVLRDYDDYGEWLWIIQKAAQHYASGGSGAQREDGGYVLAQPDSLRADGEKI